MNGLMSKCSCLLESLEEGEQHMWLQQSPMVKEVKARFREVTELRNSDAVLRALVTCEPAVLRKAFDVSERDFDAMW
eukprot:5352250-Amphidinium_carterae.1